MQTNNTEYGYYGNCHNLAVIIQVKLVAMLKQDAVQDAVYLIHVYNAVCILI